MNPHQMVEAVYHIVELKKWVENLPVLDRTVDRHLKEIFAEAKKRKATYRIVTEFQEMSRNNVDNKIRTACNQLIQSYPEILSIPKRLPLLKTRIEQAINAFRGSKNPINKSLLFNVYNIYLKEYEKLRDKYVFKSDRTKVNSNLEAIKALALSTLSNITTSILFNQCVPVLLGQLFIYLSIMKSGINYYDALKYGDASDYLLQPHPVQVLSILRFIGCDDEEGLAKKVWKSITGN